jgi:ferredoxin
MGNSKCVVDLLLDLWPVYKLGMWLGRQPGVGAILKPAFSSKIHQVTMLPVNEPITRGEQTVLPYVLLGELVERSGACFIMRECICRSKEHCQSHPIDLGCLFLGEGARHIHPSLGRLCSAEEAKAHIQRGLQAGLYPLIAHTVVDAYTLGIPYKRMLTVCFCCECCCLVQRGLRKGPASLLEVVQPLPGVKVVVGEDCTSCGECVSSCPVGAIAMNHHGAEISQVCKGCGICMEACPSEVIQIETKDQSGFLNEFIKRVDGYTDLY